MGEMEGYEVKATSMEMEDESGIGNICDVKIKKASNGWIVSYDTKKKPMGGSESEHIPWTTETVLFESSKEDDAFNKFKELKKKETPDRYGY
jgi:hypothetical protein